MVRLCSLFVLFLCGLTSVAQSWNLLWSDEFGGTGLDKNNWLVETGKGNNGWGNNELQYYTERPENIKLANGLLHIIAKRESFQGSDFTSARIKSQGLQAWKYGKIEARIKVPLGQGKWAAFWMLGENIKQKGWPSCGEIDIMEHVNESREVVGTIHWEGPEGYANYGKNVSIDDPSAFHIYSVEWDNNAIKWFLDGSLYHEANIANNINSTEEFHSPHFILLNLAVGGNWPGSPDASTIFPDTMTIDYVRVYKNDELTSNLRSNDFTISPIEITAPVNNELTVNYNLIKDAYVELSITDVFGRKIFLVNAENQQAGSQRNNINTSLLPLGVYLIKINIKGFSSVHKFINE